MIPLALQIFGGGGGKSGRAITDNHNAKSVTDALYDLRSAQTRSTRQFSDWAFGAINWYVSTGRATPAWEKALMRADPDAMMDYVAATKDRTDATYVRRATTYLRRHAGLK